MKRINIYMEIPRRRRIRFTGLRHGSSLDWFVENVKTRFSTLIADVGFSFVIVELFFIYFYFAFRLKTYRLPLCTCCFEITFFTHRYRVLPCETDCTCDACGASPIVLPSKSFFV